MNRGRLWQLFCASAAWWLLHAGGAYAVWWCIVWHADAPAWGVAVMLLAVSWAGTELGYRLLWTETRIDPPRWVRYLLAVGAAVAVAPFTGTVDDEAVRWQRRWFIPLALVGFIVPFVLFGWQGLFAAGFVRFLMHRYGLPALSAAGRVALDRIGRRLNRRIPCPDGALLLARALEGIVLATRRVVPS